MKKQLVIIAGPTAVGKTKIAVQLAQHYNIPVINADSRQFYSEMAIGTAAPTKEEMKDVQHFFVHDRSVKFPISAGDYEKEALTLIDSLFKSSNIALMSGGSGLYIKSVSEGFDMMPEVSPETRIQLNQDLVTKGLDVLLAELDQMDSEYASKVDRKNPQRIIRALEIIRSTGKPYSSFRKRDPNHRYFNTIKIGLTLDREELYERIELRVEKMISQGLFKEVEGLSEYAHLDPLQTVGYKEVFDYLDGKNSYNEAVVLLKRNTRRYAKRQLTWFRNDPEYNWFHPNQLESIIKSIELTKPAGKFWSVLNT